MGALCCARLCCAQLSCAATPPPAPEYRDPVTVFGDCGPLTEASSERIQFIGRYVINGTDIEYSYSSSIIRFVVETSSDSCQLGVTMGSPGDGSRAKKMRGLLGSSPNGIPKKAGAFMNVYINGVLSSKFAVEDGDPKQYIIANPLPEGKSLIEISKCTEGLFGMVVFKGINMSEGVTLLAPPTRKKTIEFIGDSDTTAYCSVGPYTLRMVSIFKHMILWSDTDQSAAMYISKSFGADHHNLAVSGIGLMHQGDKYGPTNVGGPSPEHYEDIISFNWGVPLGDERYAVGTMPQVDLVVIWQGQNDVCVGCGPGKIAQGVQAYKAQLEAIRKHRPETPILCLYPDGLIGTTHPKHPLMGGFKKRQKGVTEDIKAWAVGAAEACGGSGNGIYTRAVKMDPEFDPHRDFGAMGEAGVEGQKKWARGVVPHIKDIMGWEVVSAIELNENVVVK
jgi:hypothetical protein